MLVNGAKGKTSDELRLALGYDESGLSNGDANKGYKDILQQIANNQQKFTLSIANSVIMQKGFAVLSNFSNTLKEYYDANVQQTDFAADGYNAMNMINDWARVQTKDKIKRILDGPLDPLTRLVLINAVYFKGL